MPHFRQGVAADEGFGEARARGVIRQGKGPGGVEKRPGPDILMGERQHGAGAQRIPGRQAAGRKPRRRAGIDDPFPERHKMFGSDEDFKPELAGVARPGEQDGGAVRQPDGVGPGVGAVEMPLEGKIGHAVEDRVRRSQDLLQHLCRQRSLNVHFPQAVGQIDNVGVRGRVVFEVAGDDRAHAGVDDDHIPTAVNVEDDGVVDDLSLVVQKGAVDAPAGKERFFVPTDAGRKIIGEALLQQVERAPARDQKGGHVAGVERPGAGQNGQMFVFSRPVPQRHFITAKLGHVGAVNDVPAVKQGFLGLMFHGDLLGSLGIQNCMNAPPDSGILSRI